MTWETVGPGVERFVVPGGWLYRVSRETQVPFVVVFVPSPGGVSFRLPEGSTMGVLTDFWEKHP